MSDFLLFAAAHGLIIDHIEHGRWVRVPTKDHPRKRNGTYFHGGEYAHIQNWAEMERVVTWMQDKPRTPFEQADFKKKIAADLERHQQERARKQHRAAGKAKWILEQCELDRHAYLEKKGFADMRGNVWKRDGEDPLLVIPMRYNGEVCGCQLIGSTGIKKFLYCQRTNDATFTIGQTGRAFIIEGYASAISLAAILAAAKVTATIFTAFSVGNASRLAKRLPDAFWVADRDHSGVGQTAAANSGLDWWAPPDVGDDINDYYQSVGLFRATMELKKFIALRRDVV